MQYVCIVGHGPLPGILRCGEKTRRMSIVQNRTIVFGGKGGTFLDVATYREWTKHISSSFALHPLLLDATLPYLHLQTVPYLTAAIDHQLILICVSWPVPICPGRFVQNLAVHILLASINRIRSLYNISGSFHIRANRPHRTLSRIAIQPNRNIFSGCAQYVMMMVHIVSVVG